MFLRLISYLISSGSLIGIFYQLYVMQHIGFSTFILISLMIVGYFSWLCVKRFREQKNSVSEAKAGTISPHREKNAENRPSILYLIKEGFISIQILHRYWDESTYSYVYDLKLEYNKCPLVSVYKDTDNKWVICYPDGTQRLKLTDEILESLDK